MKSLLRMVLAAMFIALGLVMPFITGQIPEIGSMLLPMHIPVLICGFVCGWKYGLAVGFIVPLLRSFIFGMPPILTAIGPISEIQLIETCKHDYCDDSWTCGMGNCKSRDLWSARNSIFMANVYGRSIA